MTTAFDRNPVFKGGIYVATNSKGVYYSDDFDGEAAGDPTWTAVNDGLSSLSIQQMILDPWAPETRQFARIGGEIWRREDGGSWTKVLSQSEIGTLCGIDPIAADDMFPNINKEGHVMVAVHPYGTFSSYFRVVGTEDAGDSWAHIGYKGGTYSYGVSYIEIGMLQGDSLYSPGNLVYMMGRSGAGGSAAHIFRSEDEGSSWSEVGSYTTYGWLHIAAANAWTIFMAASGLARSANGGASWSSVFGSSVADMFTYAFDDELIRLLSGSHLYKSEDDGDNFTDMGNLGNGMARIGGLHRDSDQLFLGRSASGSEEVPHVIWASRDEGSTLWAKSGANADQTDGGGDSIPYNCGGICFRGILPVTGAAGAIYVANTRLEGS